MKRLALSCALLLSASWLAAAPAVADGVNVARFLARNRLAKRKASSFDKAFTRLRSAAKQSSARGILLARSRSSRKFFGTDKTINSSNTLLLRGGRVYMQLTTTSSALRPSRSSETVRVPTGRLFGWYGKMLLRAQFPDLSVKQLERALAATK